MPILQSSLAAPGGIPLLTGSYSNPTWIASLSETKVLPSQTGNAGRYLTTDGNSTSWTSGLTSGSSANGFIQYSGLAAVSGQINGGSTTPTNTVRLNYEGNFYATAFNVLGTTDTATAATHYFVETGSDGFIRPKTLANAQAEIVTAATVYSVGVTSGTATQSFVAYNSTTATAGRFDGGSTAPSGTTRLNYGGYLYATRFYTDNQYSITGAAALANTYPDVTTGTISIGGGLTTGTLNLGSVAVGAKTVNIGTSTGTTVVYGSTVRLPNAGTPGAGKLLQSDASGNATWQTITTGATLTNDTTTNASTYYPVLAFNQTSGALSIANTSSTKLYYNPSTGTLNSTVFNSLSDASVKTDIKIITNSIDTINKISGVEFLWKETQQKSAGVIAQELESVIPHLVATDEKGMKSVNYNGIIAYLIQAVKELSSRVNELEQR